MISSFSSRGGVRSWFVLATWLIVGVGLLALPGCSGCRKEDPVAKKKREDEEKKKKEKEKKEKEKEKPKPDFEASRLVTFPDDTSTDSELNYVKHGHWVSANQLMKTNNFDFHGEMDIETIDTQGNLLNVEKTGFQLTLTRPVSLPKGQPRFLELVIPVPRQQVTYDQDGLPKRRMVGLRRRLRALRGTGGGGEPFAGDTFSPMPDYQFYLVGLSSSAADSFQYLRHTASISPPDDEFSETSKIFYRVALPKDLDLRVPLPTNSLTWTSIAYLLWDDLPPTKLLPEQHDALLDWLHWGGQLIVSGPAALDQLRGSFLEPYLPVQKTKTIELTNASFETLNKHWSIPSRRFNDPQRLEMVKDGKMAGCAWTKHPDANFVDGTGELIAERRVGAGRVVATAFPLNDTRVMGWKSVDNLINGALLRRPPREFRRAPGELQTHFEWRGFNRAYAFDPRLISTVRYFSRDIGHSSESVEEQTLNEIQPPPKTTRPNPFSVGGEPEVPRESTVGKQPRNSDWHFDGYSYARETGVAGWNDFSGVAVEARESLGKAAGIDVPEASFVVRVLLIYLIVLVPLNWGFFRLIRRVEWAWGMAPVIAIAGAVMVVRYAQLDIGFIRSRTELSLLELQGGYRRGHLTRFISLYSSLSTGYTATFDSADAFVLPFHKSAQEDVNKSTKSVGFFRDQLVKLTGFPVSSNSTETLHSEQMWSSGGSVSLAGDAVSGWTLKNDSNLPLRSTGVLYRDEHGQLHRAYLGDIAAKTSKPLNFTPVGETEWEFPEWQGSKVMGAQVDNKGEVNLSGVVKLATQRLRLRDGDIRLIGYCDEELPGIEFRPAASQTLTRTLILCHLKRGALPPAKSDINTKREMDEEQKNDSLDND